MSASKTANLSLDQLLLFLRNQSTLDSEERRLSSDSETELEEGLTSLAIGVARPLDNLPEPFSSLAQLQPHLQRIGVLESFRDRGQTFFLSFYTSLIRCLDPDQLGVGKKEQYMACQKFHEKMLTDFTQHNLFREYEYHARFRWTRKELLADLQQFRDTPKALYFLSQYLGANFLVLDLESKQIQATYSTPQFNRFRDTFFFLRHLEGSYEPLCTLSKSRWHQGDPLLDSSLSVFEDSLVRLPLTKKKEEWKFEVGEEALDHWMAKYPVPAPEGESHEGSQEGSQEAVVTSKELEGSLSDEEAFFSNVTRKKNTYAEDEEPELSESESEPELSHQDDQAETEYEAKSLKKNHQKDIFLKQTGTEDSEESESDESESESESEDEAVKVEVSMKMTLNQLQKMAEKHGVAVVSHTHKLKNGKPRMKTKKQLFEDLQNL